MKKNNTNHYPTRQIAYKNYFAIFAKGAKRGYFSAICIGDIKQDYFEKSKTEMLL